jgi:hypothetical protein
MNWISTIQMVSYEHAHRPLLRRLLHSWTRYGFRNGKIGSLDWSIYFTG